MISPSLLFDRSLINTLISTLGQLRTTQVLDVHLVHEEGRNPKEEFGRIKNVFPPSMLTLTIVQNTPLTQNYKLHFYFESGC